MSFAAQIVFLALGMILVREADTSGAAALDFVMTLTGILLIRRAYKTERRAADA